MSKIICPECNREIEMGKFCSECGHLLELNKVTVSENVSRINLEPISENSLKMNTVKNTTVSDKGLKILIDYCRKTVATVGGDGYEEYILYQRSEDIYELHYYSKYEYMNDELHLAYKSDKNIKEQAYKKIEELNLDSYENHKGEAMMGGLLILRYAKDGKEFKITSENLPFENRMYINEIRSIICKTADDKNRID